MLCASDKSNIIDFQVINKAMFNTSQETAFSYMHNVHVNKRFLIVEHLVHDSFSLVVEDDIL